MDRVKDPFVTLAPETLEADLDELQPRLASQETSIDAIAPSVGRLHGFDPAGRPQVSGMDARKGEIVAARSTVQLRRSMVGSDVLILFEAGDRRLPIIVGVILPTAPGEARDSSEPAATVQVDGERRVIEAEREIELRCGAASITLTRAGKVIIKGNYILSRSTGYNKIKGAAIDLN